MSNPTRALLSWFKEAIQSPGVGGTLARGASTALAIRGCGMAAAFGVQILLARLLGVTEYGIYAYALSWLNLLSRTSAVGFDIAGVRLVPQYLAGGERALLAGFLRTARRVATLGSVALAVLCAAVVFFLRGQLGAGLALTFWLACLTLPAIAHLQLRSAILRGLKRIAAAQAPLELVRPLVVGGLVLVAYRVREVNPDGPLAMAATLLANLVALLLVMWWLHDAVARSAIASSRPAPRQREWLRLSLTLLGLTGFSLMLSQTDVLMIGALLDTTQAGIYSAGSRLAGLVSFGLVAVNSIAAPMISELYSSHRGPELRRLLRLAAWGVFAFALPAVLLLAGLGRPLLRLFGPDFEAAYVPLLILLVGQLVNSLAGSVGYLMTMTGHEIQAAKILGIIAALNVLLNGTLIPIFGIAGAAFSTAVSMVTWNLAMVSFVWHRLGLNPTLAPLSR